VYEALLDPRDGALAVLPLLRRRSSTMPVRLNIAESMRLWRARMVWRAGERATSPVAGFA
jgi:hypothetical protein